MGLGYLTGKFEQALHARVGADEKLRRRARSGYRRLCTPGSFRAREMNSRCENGLDEKIVGPEFHGVDGLRHGGKTADENKWQLVKALQ